MIVETGWGRLDWLVSGELDPGAELTFGVVTINPGEANPLHLHPNCEEVLYVLSGTCDHVLGDRTIKLGPGGVIRIPRNVPHHAKTTGDEPLIAVIAFSSADRETVTL